MVIPRGLAKLSLLAFYLVTTVAAEASEVKVMISGGLTAAYRELVPQFELATGNTVITVYGPSMEHNGKRYTRATGAR
jgi:molybdate transport system substrate-binding protein